MKNKSGYSLLEIISVLAIISIVLTFSILSVSSFQQFSQMSTEISNILYFMKNVQSNALANKYENTNLSVDPNNVFTYTLEINKNNIINKICDGVENLNPNCEIVNTHSLEIGNENFIFDFESIKSCSQISFQGKSNIIKLTNKSNLEVNACCVYLKNVKSNDSRTIYVDKISREISIEEDNGDNYCQI